MLKATVDSGTISPELRPGRARTLRTARLLRPLSGQHNAFGPSDSASREDVSGNGGSVGRPPHKPLSPAQAKEVREIAERLRESEDLASKARKRLTLLAERYGSIAVAEEAKKVGARVTRQALEKRIEKL
jgi:hypothetical protein